jgi:hypothetical protein
MAGETRTSQLLVRIQPSLKAAAEKAARDDHRSLSSLVEKLLTEHLKAKGYLRNSQSDQGLRPEQLNSENDG